jgi:hypothetical protein
VFYSDDPDGDGVSNLDEEALGSDPKDPASNLKLVLQQKGGRLGLVWSSAEGRTYTLEGGKVPGHFEKLEEGIQATPPQNFLELDPVALGENGFFRVLLEAPSGPPAVQ